MSEPFLSEVKIVSFNFAPKGWALCNGQLLPINQNQALFSLLGTTYGGNGQTTFALPNLQGRIPIHFGNGHTLGEAGGAENHTLIASEMPAHTHTFSASNATPNQGTPAGNMWASNSGAYSSAQPDATMTPASISNAGGSQPHTNVQPYLVLNFIIALQGIFPSQN
jgi:microcystin-dependent protein